MVSTGNKSKLVTSEICQKCGKCCKEFAQDRWDLDNGLRFLWMENRNIKVEDTPFKIEGLGINRAICFKFPCKHLEFRDRKYWCNVWDKERPDFCNTYPDHMFYDVEEWNREKIKRILEFNSKFCPALKDVSVDDVIKMLEEKNK